MASRAAVMELRGKGVEVRADGTSSKGNGGGPSRLSTDLDLSALDLRLILNDMSLSAIGKVEALCRLLRIHVPQYRWTKDEAVRTLVSGGAVFVGERAVELQGVIGEVFFEFGIKKAREECASRVVSVLSDMARRRIVHHDDEF